MKCIVSGATGFIGRQLCKQLEASGHTVIALSKSASPVGSGQASFAMDLVDCDPDANILKGADVFFHLAGIAHQHAQASAYAALNYRATLRLARLSSAAGIRLFVFLSSVKAMGPPHSHEAREESEVSIPADAYGRSKWLAECALRDEFSGDGMSIAIVRPALVYGGEAKGNLQSLVTGVRWGLPRPPQGGSRSMIALEDLVELLCVIAQRPPSGVETWIACGSDSYSTRDIYDMLRIALGKSPAVSWLPHWLWRLVPHLLDRILLRDGESTYNKLFGWELYSNASVVRDTGWRPCLRLNDVVDQMVKAQRLDR